MHTTKRKNVLNQLLILIWPILCVTIFIIYPGKISFIHQFIFSGLQGFSTKLARIELFTYTVNLIRALAGVLFYLSACISLGALFLKCLGFLKSRFQSFQDGFVTSGSAFLIGQGVFSVVFLTLAGVYKLTPNYVILVTVSGFLLGIRSVVGVFRLNSANEDLKFFGKSRNDRGILWLSIGILVLSVLYSSSRLSYDAVAEYFSDQKITAMTNYVTYFPNDPFIVSSFHAGIQYTALIQVFGDQSARLLSWINGWIIIIFSLAIAEKVGLSTRARLMLLALLLTSTAFMDLWGDGKIDLACTAPIVAAVYWMTGNTNSKSKGILVLVGFLTGWAMISRPFNIFLLGMYLAIYYLIQAYTQLKSQQPDFKALLNSILWISPAVLLLLSFHFAANWVILGDPLIPVINALHARTSNWQWSFDPKDIWIIRLLYPFIATFINTPQSLGNISPLFLAFLPGILIKNIRKNVVFSRPLAEILVAASVTLILWITLFFTVIEIRYAFFLWILLFIALAPVIESMLLWSSPFIQSMLQLVLITTLAFMAVRIIYISIDTYSPIDQRGYPQCNDIDLCKFLKPVNDSAAPGDRVLALNAYRYYLRPDLFACATTHDEYLSVQKLSSGKSDDFWTEVYRRGYKYVLYEENFVVRTLFINSFPDPQNPPSWLHLEPIYGSPGDFEVAYKIQVKNPPVQSETVCRQTEAGIWELESATSQTVK